jgi:capsular exopolysaccharide synthesis family protein
MNDKITTREDIAKISQVPIIGEIGHADDAPGTIVVNKSRDVIAEQFRIIRTNLQYLIGNQDKYTILVTSSISGEGKSFASSNLAVVIAMLGKRVALLEFDLRKPKIVKELGLPKAAIGITNVLMGNASLDQIKIPYPSITNLDIIPSGPTPPNPAEIIMLPSLTKMMEQLKNDYDVVIIDSAPVGLVSDSFSLSKKADAVLYVVRQRYTFKKQMHFVDEIYTQSKLGRMGILVNDVKVGGSHGYYGYGYGYGGHGYGYGYGYFDDRKQKNIFAKIISYFKGNQV